MLFRKSVPVNNNNHNNNIISILRQIICSGKDIALRTHCSFKHNYHVRVKQPFVNLVFW